ncbi:calcium-activated potassium channel slo-1 [Ditylenchus destructor]|uniref:Calcium-activated potassium channel slo-1 n=1 Tax=Ditylenchus destructor TaxID=166010 RepID=A0AAD4R1Z2_9BILA|nr:calcium-activated potassium channel slo-1 [Ditylenchus destructor]
MGKVVVILVCLASVGSVLLYFIDVSRDFFQVESCHPLSESLTQQIDVGLNVFFLIIFLKRSQLDVCTFFEFILITPSFLAIYMERSYFDQRLPAIDTRRLPPSFDPRRLTLGILPPETLIHILHCFPRKQLVKQLSRVNSSFFNVANRLLPNVHVINDDNISFSLNVISRFSPNVISEDGILKTELCKRDVQTFEALILGKYQKSYTRFGKPRFLRRPWIQWKQKESGSRRHLILFYGLCWSLVALTAYQEMLEDLKNTFETATEPLNYGQTILLPTVAQNRYVQRFHVALGANGRKTDGKRSQRSRKGDRI